MSLIKYISFFMLIIILLGCEEPIDRQVNFVENELLVVEGLITNERKQHEVKISRIFRDLNSNPEGVSGVRVFISDEELVFPLIEDPLSPGTYKTDSIRGVFGKTYILYFLYNGTEYFAADRMAPIAPLEPIVLNQDDRGAYFIDFRETSDPSIQKFNIDWTNTRFCETPNCNAKVNFYTLENIDINEAFPPPKQTVFFPPGSIIIRNKLSLSQQHQAYLRSLLIETEWRGSIFDVDKNNVPTNLSEGAIGFFGASTVLTDTIVAE